MPPKLETEPCLETHWDGGASRFSIGVDGAAKAVVAAREVMKAVVVKCMMLIWL
jgi:hypothetical protein